MSTPAMPIAPASEHETDKLIAELTAMLDHDAKLGLKPPLHAEISALLARLSRAEAPAADEPVSGGPYPETDHPRQISYEYGVRHGKITGWTAPAAGVALEAVAWRHWLEGAGVWNLVSDADEVAELRRAFPDAIVEPLIPASASAAEIAELREKLAEVRERVHIAMEQRDSAEAQLEAAVAMRDRNKQDLLEQTDACGKWIAKAKRYEADLSAAAAKERSLRHALQPFAEIDEPGEFFSDSENLNVTITLYGGNELVLTLDNLTVGQLRKARATLTDTAGER